MECSVTEDGYETTWATNVLAPFILFRQLLPLVKHRIVNVSSISAAGQLSWEHLEDQMAGRKFSSHSAYSLSKLAVQVRLA